MLMFSRFTTNAQLLISSRTLLSRPTREVRELKAVIMGSGDVAIQNIHTLCKY